MWEMKIEEGNGEKGAGGYQVLSKERINPKSLFRDFLPIFLGLKAPRERNHLSLYF